MGWRPGPPTSCEAVLLSAKGSADGKKRTVRKYGSMPNALPQQFVTEKPHTIPTSWRRLQKLAAAKKPGHKSCRSKKEIARSGSHMQSSVPRIPSPSAHMSEYAH